jgi:hypothetical protein
VLGAWPKRAWAARNNATVSGLAGNAGCSTEWHQAAKSSAISSATTGAAGRMIAGSFEILFIID